MSQLKVDHLLCSLVASMVSLKEVTASLRVGMEDLHKDSMDNLSKDMVRLLSSSTVSNKEDTRRRVEEEDHRQVNMVARSRVDMADLLDTRSSLDATTKTSEISK